MQSAPIELALLLILRVQFELLRLVLLHQLGDRLHRRLVGDPFRERLEVFDLAVQLNALVAHGRPPAGPPSDTSSFRFPALGNNPAMRENGTPPSSCGQDDSGYGGLAGRPDVGTTLSTRLADE